MTAAFAGRSPPRHVDTRGTAQFSVDALATVASGAGRLGDGVSVGPGISVLAGQCFQRRGGCLGDNCGRLRGLQIQVDEYRTGLACVGVLLHDARDPERRIVLACALPAVALPAKLVSQAARSA
jgi:hypothetical protein